MAGKKEAGLYILRYLYENTDDEHGASNADITAYLKKMGIELNERSILPNINSLNECFEDIPYFEIQQYMEKNKKRYRLINRPLEMTEVEMLVSAINTVKSFSRSDAANLREKLYKQLSSYQQNEVKPAVSAKKNEGRRGSLSWNLEVINKAIAAGVKVYVTYDSSGDLKERHISPYKIHTSADGIYVLGKCDEHEADISRFRIDRITKINLCEDRLTPCLNQQELYDMLNLSKDMSYGERGTAVFIFTKQVEKVVYDRYGSGITVHKLSDGRMRVSVEEYLTNTLLGWIFSLGRDIEVVGNRTLVNMMKERVEQWSARL